MEESSRALRIINGVTLLSYALVAKEVISTSLPNAVRVQLRSFTVVVTKGGMLQFSRVRLLDTLLEQ